MAAVGDKGWVVEEGREGGGAALDLVRLRTSRALEEGRRRWVDENE